jgi:hypothetical protein
MSATPANASLKVVRGSTWEDVFTYLDPDRLPVDLTGYEARMHVRTIEGQYGLSGPETLVMELSTTNGRLEIDVPETGVVSLRVDAEDTVALNPENMKKASLCYSIELYLPEEADPLVLEYVIPLAQGKVTIFGETTR